MIQNPIRFIDVVSNSDNVKDYIRRVRETKRTHRNPNNRLQVNAEQYNSYYKFSIVRNPWMRIHSWYKNVMRDEAHQRNYKVPPDISFLDFVKEYAGTGYLRPQTYWLKQFDNNLNFNFIGKFENLNGAFEQVASDLKFLTDKELPHRIEGQKSDPSTDFNQEVVDFIADYYAEEIELFDYTFD
jgi:hypothetical protein